MFLDLLMLPLAWLGRLQGSKQPYYLEDWLHAILKYACSGLILGIVVVYLSGYNPTAYEWAAILTLSAAATWAGEGRGIGWVAGFWVNGYPSGEPDGWMKYIPTHKIPNEQLSKYVTTFVRGMFWGLLYLPLAYFVEFFIYMPIIYGIATILAFQFAELFCLSLGQRKYIWETHEWLRHPFAYLLITIMMN